MSKAKVVLVSLCILMTVIGQANATRLKDDSTALTRGSTNVNVAVYGQQFDVDVDYAVFAPGDYGWQDFSGGSRYIYAYQIYNNSTSQINVDFFFVGILNGAIDIDNDNMYEDDTHPESVGGVGAFPAAFIGDPVHSASAGFFFDGISAGQHSQVLVFTSIYAPTGGYGTVAGIGRGYTIELPVPNPVPEPATLAILAAASGFVMLKRKK